LAEAIHLDLYAAAALCALSTLLRLLASSSLSSTPPCAPGADFFSIPQSSRGAQKLAINSLMGYASSAHAFVIVAPQVVTMDGKELSVDTYNRRMWCRAENLAHSLRNGTSGMWVATGPHESQCIRKSEYAMQSNRDSAAGSLAFVRSNLHVFEAVNRLQLDPQTSRWSHTVLLTHSGAHVETGGNR
jgi:hypothetical protein